MSLPYLIFNCDKCDFESSSMRAWGSRLYKVEDQYFPIKKTLGFCLECKNFESIEEIPVLEVFERAKEIHLSLKDDSSEFPYTEDNDVLDIAVEKNLYILEDVIMSKRPPVCLKCGSIKVSDVSLPKNVSYSETEFIVMEYSHPECGGKLLVRGSGRRRVAIRHDIFSLYDTQGKLIETGTEVDFTPAIGPHRIRAPLEK